MDIGARFTSAAFALLLMMLVVGGPLFFSSCGGTSSDGTTDLTMAVLPSDAAVPLFVAQDKGIFAASGLNVTLQQYATGPMAVDALINNEADIAGTAEYALVPRAFAKADISAIGSLDRAFNVFLVGSTAAGITKAADLKGKRIGATVGTLLEFYLSRFLTLQGVDTRDVTLVNMTPAQTVDAMTSGEIDAAVTNEPFVTQIQQRLTSGTVKWSVQAGQANFALLMCRNDWIKAHPELVERFLKSLVQADAFVVDHPAEAKAILRDREGTDGAYVESIWSELEFAVSLDEPLVLALEDEARWTAAKSSPPATANPNFLDFIYADGLKAVQPDAVTIAAK